MIEKEIELIVTYDCNWDCSFCAVDTHNRPKLSFEKVKQKLELIKNNYMNYNITLSGGELGMMKKHELEYIIDYLKPISNSISLNTNGLFLKKYTDLTKKLDYILYHCSENLDDIVEQFEHPNLDYMIVIDDINFKNFESFMENNSNITFDVVGATKADGGLDSILNSKNRIRLLTSFKKFKNISKKSLKRLIKEKDFGNIIYI